MTTRRREEVIVRVRVRRLVASAVDGHVQGEAHENESEVVPEIAVDAHVQGEAHENESEVEPEIAVVDAAHWPLVEGANRRASKRSASSPGEGHSSTWLTVS